MQHIGLKLRITQRLGRLATAQCGFSLIEQIVAVALVTIITTQVLVGMPTLVRGAAISNARVEMQNLARSQAETIKQGPYLSATQGYPAIELPEKFAMAIQVEPASQYSFTGGSTETLTDVSQLVTVQVFCVLCSPPAEPVAIQFYKVKR